VYIYLPNKQMIWKTIKVLDLDIVYRDWPGKHVLGVIRCLIMHSRNRKVGLA
jgi:hypothetical protein